MMLITPIATSAQAACNGGDCPIVGGSLRTVVGGGFLIPQLGDPAAGPPGTPNDGLNHQMSLLNTANGFVLPTPSAMATIGGTGPPYSIMVPVGQLTYGDAPATTPNGRFATPVLVQVPLFVATPVLLGVSTIPVPKW